MSTKTIKVDGQDVEVMPFGRDAWLCRGTEQDRLTAVYPCEPGLLYGRRGIEDAWWAEGRSADDLKCGYLGKRIAAALDYFWPGWRERDPGHTREPTP